MRYFLSAILLVFFIGCDSDTQNDLKVSPPQSEIPDDVPIAKSEPQNKVDSELPPLPVTE